VEGRCTDLQEVSAIMGRTIESTRRGKSLLVSHDEQPEILIRRETSSMISRASSSGPSSSKTVGRELGDSPPAKRNCGVRSSEYLCQSKEKVMNVRSIVVVPPQPSEKSRELEKSLRDRLVGKLNVRSSVPSDPSGISTRNVSIDESTMKGKNVVEEVLVDCQHLYRHIETNFLWPMIKKLSVHAKIAHPVENENESEISLEKW
jgi:hypothetical protein